MQATRLSTQHGASTSARSSLLAVPSRRRCCRTQALNAELVGQLATAGALAAGAWMLLDRDLSAYVEQDKLNNKNSAPCPRCHGARYEPCVCTRWSDGDSSGCSSCSKTGYMACRSCGGGGTAVPLLASVRKDVPRM